ncbi:MAG: hypothetical protein HYZ09_03710 [Candidatus Kerfeldbacteria bacterium]|nr:hypothetical protein [Candidatus Kerfeldbacteria bacterium]
MHLRLHTGRWMSALGMTAGSVILTSAFGLIIILLLPMVAVQDLYERSVARRARWDIAQILYWFGWLGPLPAYAIAALWSPWSEDPYRVTEERIVNGALRNLERRGFVRQVGPLVLHEHTRTAPVPCYALTEAGVKALRPTILITRPA